MSRGVRVELRIDVLSRNFKCNKPITTELIVFNYLFFVNFILPPFLHHILFVPLYFFTRVK